jgi:hypothetical protein
MDHKYFRESKIRLDAFAGVKHTSLVAHKNIQNN